MDGLQDVLGAHQHGGRRTAAHPLQGGEHIGDHPTPAFQRPADCLLAGQRRLQPAFDGRDTVFAVTRPRCRLDEGSGKPGPVVAHGLDFGLALAALLVGNLEPVLDATKLGLAFVNLATQVPRIVGPGHDGGGGGRGRRHGHAGHVEGCSGEPGDRGGRRRRHLRHGEARAEARPEGGNGETTGKTAPARPQFSSVRDSLEETLGLRVWRQGGKRGPVSSAMIGVARQNGDGPVYLLGRHDSHELMRPGHCAEGEHHGRLGAQLRIESVWSADRHHEGRRPRVTSPPHIGSERLAGNRFSAFIEQNEPRARRHQRPQCPCFLDLAVFRTACPPFLDLAQLDPGKTDTACPRDGPLKITGAQFAFRASLEPPDGCQDQTHRDAPSDGGA